MANLIRPLGNDHFLYLLLLCGSLFGRQKWPLPPCDPELPKLCSALWHIAGPWNMSASCTGNTRLTLDSANADFRKRYNTESSSSWHRATISTCNFHLGPGVITVSVAADHLITLLDLFSLLRMWEQRVMKWIYTMKKGKHGIAVSVWRGNSGQMVSGSWPGKTEVVSMLMPVVPAWKYMSLYMSHHIPHAQ